MLGFSLIIAPGSLKAAKEQVSQETVKEEIAEVNEEFKLTDAQIQRLKKLILKMQK
ncbi:hypothetical protein ANHYDRO_00356 [Anaerococcus hydrogenalis DSM 7454]|uniref:Uncharacterized protein n=1 Tax=Anaerococcus hydrogenalis DSM 7454 TaxID=561177 RepID=B6W738_9FIRM|nr:hypothetical protein [Anaerococcus hydrogenalis]EEB36755.1 hypothetical protein ANHYDRO_00356 [Anaerococcus hydrogenalis DSM 7454]